MKVSAAMDVRWLRQVGRHLTRGSLALLAMVTLAYATAPQEKAPDPRLDIALCSIPAQTPEQALKNCNDIIDHAEASREDRMIAHLMRARLLVIAGDGDRAIADYDVVLAIDPDKVEALIERAALHRAKGDRRNALLDYTAALKLDPNLTDIRDARLELVRELERLGATMGLPQKP